MASMPGYHVSKGPFRFLDGLFGDPSTPVGYANFTNALNALTLAGGSAEATMKAAAQARTIIDPASLPQAATDHFGADWLGLGHGWKKYSPADVLRHGITEAITEALRPPVKPMEFFWVCAKDKEFQVYYSRGPNQVTVMILTPLPDPPGGGSPHAAAPLTTPENIWVVKKEEAFDAAYPSPVGLTHLGPTTDGVLPAAQVIKRQIYHT